MTFRLTSPAFSNDGRIPNRHTCDGDDISPPLHWDGPPFGTMSYALICVDPDAPGKPWYHWAIFDIPPAEVGIPEGFPCEPRVGGVRQAVNDFQRVGYGGPCPPRGHGDHHYRFELIPLVVATLPLDERCDCRAVEEAARGYLIDSATLIGTYSRE